VRAISDRPALLTGIVRIGGWALLAVEGLGEDARRGGLPRPARPREQVRVCNRPVSHRVAERLLDVRLPDDIIEGLGAVLAVPGQVGHGVRLLGVLRSVLGGRRQDRDIVRSGVRDQVPGTRQRPLMAASFRT